MHHYHPYADYYIDLDYEMGGADDGHLMSDGEVTMMLMMMMLIMMLIMLIIKMVTMIMMWMMKMIMMKNTSLLIGSHHSLGLCAAH